MRSLPTALTLAFLCGSPCLAQDVVWSTELAPITGGTYAEAVVPLGSGQVIGVRGSFTSFDPIEWFVLSMDGEEILTHPFAPGVSLAGGSGLCQDGNGGAYLLISEFAGAYGGPSLGSYDAVILRLSSGGQLTGAQRIGGDDRDVGRAILADGAGGFFLAGETRSSNFGTPSGAPRDAFVAHVDSSGATTWIRREGSGQFEGTMHALAADGSGGVLAGGSFDDVTNVPVVPGGFAAGYDASGSRSFLHSLHPFGGAVVAIEPTSAGYVELAVDQFGGYFCIGRSTAGAPLWDVRLEPTSSTQSYAGSVVRRHDGTYLIGGTVNDLSGRRQHIRGFAEGGTVLFDASYPGPNGRSTGLTGLFLDGIGSVYGVGTTSVVGGAIFQNARVDRIALETLGTTGCPGQPNSTGMAARTRLVGSDVRAANRLTLFTGGIPPLSTGYYLVSLDADLVPGAGGSQGDLCLGGSIGRLNRAGEVQFTGFTGGFHLSPDLGSLPGPNGAFAAFPGDTLHFQAWYRDTNPTLTSNFSSSVGVLLN